MATKRKALYQRGARVGISAQSHQQDADSMQRLCPNRFGHSAIATQGVFQPFAPLGHLTTYKPESPERACQSEARFAVYSPPERGTQVIMFRLQAVQPGGLLWAGQV